MRTRHRYRPIIEAEAGMVLIAGLLPDIGQLWLIRFNTDTFRVDQDHQRSTRP